MMIGMMIAVAAADPNVLDLGQVETSDRETSQRNRKAKQRSPRKDQCPVHHLPRVPALVQSLLLAQVPSHQKATRQVQHDH